MATAHPQPQCLSFIGGLATGITSPNKRKVTHSAQGT